jgi:hypothetical protein
MLNSKMEGRGWLDAATCAAESKIVHFRQLFGEYGMKALPLDTVGKSMDKASIPGKAGPDCPFSLFVRIYAIIGGPR